MELRVLKYFLMVAREENITKAAAVLHVTQPTLSRQLMQLEEELGVKLFHRSNHNIVLTEEGMLLKQRAQDIVALADRTKRDFLNKTDGLTGEISIGSGEFQSTALLAEIIAAFHQKYPSVQYSLYSGNAENIADYIERGFLDMGLMSEPVDIRKYNFISLPCKEVWGVWAAKDSDFAKLPCVRPQDLENQSLIMANSTFARSLQGTWLGDAQKHVQIVATGNLLYNMAVLANSGLGAVLGIRLNCTYNDLCFRPLEPCLETGTVLAWRKEQLFSPAGDAFIDFAKTYIKRISEDAI